MNKLIVILILLTSCKDMSREESKQVHTEHAQFSTNTYVVEIDSCEYIIATKTWSDGGVGIIHKHNCKFCAERINDK